MSPRTVFLSHTSDLSSWPDGRTWVAAAMDAVSGAGDAVSDMKYFKAKDEPSVAVSEAAVEAANVYVGIIGWNYGTPVPQRPDVSFTEYEFEVATRNRIPRLIFLVPPRQGWRGRTLPTGPLADRQRAFRDRLKNRSGLTIKEVESPDRLSEELSRALHDLGTGRKWFSAAPSLDGSETPRPAELDAVVDGLCDEERAVRTVALWGPGGFGKSTLAQLVAHDERVRRRFADGVLWLDLGGDVVGERLAGKLNGATYHLTGERPPITSPEEAGTELGRALRDRRMLIVVDDVWHDSQVKATTKGDTPSVLLFTTRKRSLVPRSAKIVEVGALDEASATALLTADVAPCSPRLVAEMLKATGSCAFLLDLVNGYLRDGGAPDPILKQFLDAYENEEPEVRGGKPFEQFIGTSVARLAAEDRARFAELAVLPADVTVDAQVVRVLWASTGGWSELQSRRLLALLSDLCLVVRNEAAGVGLHDVIHDYVRARTSQADRARLNRAMLDAHRAGLSTAAGVTAWWELPANCRYMWSWTVEHLAAAGLQRELDHLVCHPAWIAARLNRAGPEGVLSDLKHGSTALGKQLADAVRQSAHLFGALSPDGSVVATLASRLSRTPESATVAQGLTGGLAAPHLVMTAPAPDLPHPALDRVLPGSVKIHFLVPLPTAGWLATAAWDGDGSGERCAVTLWDPTTGERLRDLDGVSAPLTAMTADPGGRWIAAADRQSVRVWGTDDGRLRRTHAGGAHELTSLGGGRWLVALDRAELRVLDPVTGEPLQTFRGDGITFEDVVADPAGTWLAVQSKGDVFIVKPATGTVVSRVANPIRHEWHSLQNRNRMAAAPDGSWLAVARGDAFLLWKRDRNEWDAISYPYADSLAADPRGRWIALLGAWSSVVAVWDTARRELRWEWSCSSNGEVLLVDPQGRWLATGGPLGVDVYDAVDGKVVQHFAARTRTAGLTCDPAGRFVAAIQADSPFVHLWEISTGHRHTLPHAGWVTELTADTHGGWFAFADDLGDVQVWNWPPPNFDALDTSSSAQVEGVGALAGDAELRCLATVDNGGSLRLWDADTGTMRHLPRRAYRKALAVAPNGAWVATIREHRLEIADVPSGVVRHIIKGVHANERLLAIPHWNAVAAYVPSAIRVWHADSGRLILDFPHSSWRTDGLLADPLGGGLPSRVMTPCGYGACRAGSSWL